MNYPAEWQVAIKRLHHSSRIVISFPYHAGWIQQIKAIKGAQWSSEYKCWHFPDDVTHRRLFNLPVVPELHLDTMAKVQRLVHWMKSKRYSENTIRNYQEALNTFLRFYAEQPLEAIGAQELIRFNNEYILARNLSHAYQNQVVNVIKLLFREVLGRNLDADLIHRPRTVKALPNVLSMEEVKALIQAPINLKHRCMLSLIYSCGLRCGELLALKPEHIDSNRNLLIIKQAKGFKDRVAPLSNKTIALLREYYQLYKPQHYLFEGQTKGTPYDARSLQSVMKQALAKAGIEKPATLHWLRHSYATHLLESGTDLRYIQEILGHKSSRTTEIYTHVSNHKLQQIISPFDRL